MPEKSTSISARENVLIQSENCAAWPMITEIEPIPSSEV